jgi:hypothetical protein
MHTAAYESALQWIFDNAHNLSNGKIGQRINQAFMYSNLRYEEWHKLHDVIGKVFQEQKPSEPVAQITAAHTGPNHTLDRAHG